jgi:ATP-dependent Clp protease ATP-binding subunit ClpX
MIRTPDISTPDRGCRGSRGRAHPSSSGTGVRQYQKLFEYENVKLRFTDDSLDAIAEMALNRKIGARGLRMIIEDLMLDLMYSVPGQKKLREVVVTREIVEAKDKSLTLIEKAG